MKPLYLLLAVALTGCTIQILPPQAPQPTVAPFEEEEEVVVPSAQPTPRPRPTSVPGIVTPPSPTPSIGGLYPIEDVAFVEVRTGGFSPDTIYLKRGGTVTFVNKDGASHELWADVQADLKPGGAVEKRFDLAGSYAVMCRTHPNETARIEVVEGAWPSDGSIQPTPSPTPTPAPLPMATPNSWGRDDFEPNDGAVLNTDAPIVFRIPPVDGAVRYRVSLYRGPDPYAGVGISTNDTDQTEFTHPALPEGQYLYQMAAYKPDGTTVVSNWIYFAVRIPL